MTGNIFDAFLADVANDCVNGQTGPTDWSATDKAVGRLYRGDEDHCDAFEARETRLRLGAHHDEGTGNPWPVWSMSSLEQQTWLEDHNEDGYDYSALAEGYYGEADE